MRWKGVRDSVQKSARLDRSHHWQIHAFGILFMLASAALVVFTAWTVRKLLGHLL